MTKIFLRNLEKLHPDLTLCLDKSVIIGRQAQFKLKDSKISRRHVSVTLHENNKIYLEQLGKIPCFVGGSSLIKGQIATLDVGGTFQLIEGCHNYVIMTEIRSSDNKNNENKKSPKLIKNHHWSNGLYASMNDPDFRIYSDEDIVIIKDKYPKAKYHFLALPLKEKIANLKALNKSHISLLEKMHRESINYIGENYPNLNFKLGYHAIPSMSQIHLHVISDDFISETLKTKKHWNSFNTDYFLPAENVLKDLKDSGKIITDIKFSDLLKTDLMCHKCSFKPKNIPDLKTHLLTHM